MGQMLTRQEAANYLGISVRTLDLWRANNQVAFHRIGPEGRRKIKFDTDDLDRLIEPVQATRGIAATSQESEPERKKPGWSLRGRRSRDKTGPS